EEPPHAAPVDAPTASGDDAMPDSHAGGKWSADVTQNSHALSLEPKVFELDDPKQIAASLKRSAEHSRRRKGSPFQSAMSMLTFYINRAGKQLSRSRLATINRAKDELRKDFGKQP